VTQRHTPEEKRTSNGVNSEQHYDVSRTYLLYYYYVVASNFPGLTLLPRNTKQYNHIDYISFKTVPLCNTFFAKTTLTKTERCVGALSGSRNQLLAPFLGAFPSDRNPMVTKDINVHFIIQSSNSSKLYHSVPANYTSQFRELFEATTYYYYYYYY
jgi:hypothetical protein